MHGQRFSAQRSCSLLRSTWLCAPECESTALSTAVQAAASTPCLTACMWPRPSCYQSVASGLLCPTGPSSRSSRRLRCTRSRPRMRNGPSPLMFSGIIIIGAIESFAHGIRGGLPCDCKLNLVVHMRCSSVDEQGERSEDNARVG